MPSPIREYTSLQDLLSSAQTAILIAHTGEGRIAYALVGEMSTREAIGLIELGKDVLIERHWEG